MQDLQEVRAETGRGGAGARHAAEAGGGRRDWLRRGDRAGGGRRGPLRRRQRFRGAPHHAVGLLRREVSTGASRIAQGVWIWEIFRGWIWVDVGGGCPDAPIRIY